MNDMEYDANKLFEAGGIFLFLDVPSNTEFGIDYNCWRTGDKFKGVKMIPPGIHYIYYSVTDKYGNVGLRNGFFYNFKLGEVYAKRWNKQTETIDDYEFSQDDLENFKANKNDMDRFLGAYPYEQYKRWVSLINNINVEFLNKLIPKSKIISSETALIGQKFSLTKKPKAENSEADASKPDLETRTINTDLFKAPSSLEEAESRLPEMKEMNHMSINFSKIPTEPYPKGSTPLEITKYSIDMSHRLELLIGQHQGLLGRENPNPLDVLCELQFGFICFLIGHVYEAFEQWKQLVSLICNSDTIIKKYPSLFIQFIQTLYFQLKEMPEDFFTDIITSNNFLVVNLHNLFSNINDCYALLQSENEKQLISSANLNLIQNLNERATKFKEFLQEKFDFDFELEPDEYAPVVCEEEINVN